MGLAVVDSHVDTTPSDAAVAITEVLPMKMQSLTGEEDAVMGVCTTFKEPWVRARNVTVPEEAATATLFWSFETAMAVIWVSAQTLIDFD